MLNLNCTILSQVFCKALADAADHPRWIAAIRRAFEELDSNPWIERGEHGGLLIGSPSGKVYAANGTCQCEAFTRARHACWHRAAARLVRLHDEAQQHRTIAARGRQHSAAYEKALAEINELY